MPPARRLTTPSAGRRTFEAETATTYRRAAAQRCWVCNAPDSEPVRLQRRAGSRWVSEGTLQLCTACLTALRTPRLVRQLDLGHAATLPRPDALAGPPELHPAPVTDAPDGSPPLMLVKGA